MGRAQLTLVLSLFVAACDPRVTQLGTQGGLGGAGGGSRGDQTADCRAYIACYEKTGGTKGSLNPTFGLNGTCWMSGAEPADQCATACTTSLARLLELNPTVAECGAPPPVDGGTCAQSRPIKLVVLMDQSGSMCVTDPPGSQVRAGFCQLLTPPAGITEPARVRGLTRLLNNLSMRPDVSVSLIPFEASVGNVYPAAGSNRFVPPNDPGLMTALGALQGQLGQATDFEGALDYALKVISDDIAQQKAADGGISKLAATRYAVLLITDGTPFPRCSGNDALASYANSFFPDGIWPDSPGAGSYCNDADGGVSAMDNFVPGTDRNQNAALLAKVSQILALTNQGAAGITFNTQLLFNAQRVSACGPICQDIYGVHPEVPTAQYPQAALSVARWTLNQMAIRGAGTYSEALDDFGISMLPTALGAFAPDPACP
jgi:hypothetical protein